MPLSAARMGPCGPREAGCRTRGTAAGRADRGGWRVGRPRGALSLGQDQGDLSGLISGQRRGPVLVRGPGVPLRRWEGPASAGGRISARRAQTSGKTRSAERRGAGPIRPHRHPGESGALGPGAGQGEPLVDRGPSPGEAPGRRDQSPIAPSIAPSIGPSIPAAAPRHPSTPPGRPGGGARSRRRERSPGPADLSSSRSPL